MKKILSFILLAGLAFGLNAQDAADSRKFLAGITLGGALNIGTPQTKTIDAKVGGDFMVGLMLDWNFHKNVGLTTGLEFDFDNYSTIYKNKINFRYNDKEILREKDAVSADDDFFQLESRKHKNIYLTLPVMLKFQTNFIGWFRYFGRFGVRNSMLLTTRVNDLGLQTDAFGITGIDASLDGMRTKNMMSFYKGSVGLTAGAEYNLSGATTLVAEIGYFYGFSEIFSQGKDDYRSLYEWKESTSNPGTYVKEYYTPKLKQGLIMLKVSVLF